MKNQALSKTYDYQSDVSVNISVIECLWNGQIMPT